METQDQGIGKRDDGDGSVPSGKKIVLKLKNWNPAPEMVLSPEIDRVEEIKTHYCKQCDKVFSSGKALGGHMSSAHVQASKDYSGKKVKSRLSKGSGSGDHECGVCGKEFPSQKSLYGHMRCHPERDWRGMDPPGKRRESSEDDYNVMEDDDDVMEDDDDVMKQWSVKARRGRLGRPMIVANPRQGLSLEEEEDEDGLPSRQQLLRLLNWKLDSNENKGTTSDASSSLKNHMPESPGSCSIRKDGAKKKKRKWDDSCCPYHVEKTQLIKRQCNSSESVDGRQESDTESDIIVGAICFLVNGRNITPPVVDAREKHVCNICNKVFPSHQALGGHKSSHNKLKVSIINTEDMGKNDTGNNITTHDAMEKGEGNSHVCLICSRLFPTARALGGHRKIHNNKGGRSIGNCIGIGGDGDGSKGGGEKNNKGGRSIGNCIGIGGDGDGNGSKGGGEENNKGGRNIGNCIGIGGDGDGDGDGDGSKGGGKERVDGGMDFDLNVAFDENVVAGGGDESHVN